MYSQKRVEGGIGQSREPKLSFCCLHISAHPFMAKNRPGAPVFGHCPILYLLGLTTVNCTKVYVRQTQGGDVRTLFSAFLGGKSDLRCTAKQLSYFHLEILVVHKLIHILSIIPYLMCFVDVGHFTRNHKSTTIPH